MKKLFTLSVLMMALGAFAQTATQKSFLSWEKYIDTNYVILGYDVGISTTNVVAVAANPLSGQLLDEDPALPITSGTIRFIRVDGASTTNVSFITLVSKSVNSGTYKFWCRPVGSNAFTVGSHEVGAWTNVSNLYIKRMDKVQNLLVVP